jgi:hypothetical protein
LTRQKRHNILSELGLDYNLWASGEYWYWSYCSLEVLRKVGSTLTGTGSEFAELICKINGETYHAIQRISATGHPTSNICLVELFKLRQVLQSQIARASRGKAVAYECWGYPKIRMRSPNTRERNTRMFRDTDDARGDKESPKHCSCLKSCESFYTCPRATFYRETKGLLHSENTLEYKEYS